MRSVRMVALVALVATGMVYAESQVVYTLETGGDNHAVAWENNTSAAFTSGVTDGSTSVTAGEDLTWAVRVSAGGLHSSADAANGLAPFGAANLVFDLAVYQEDGTTLVPLDAAPLGCTSGTAGDHATTTKNCKPTAKGFWSSINDGDADGARGAVIQDRLANAAFAISLYNTATPPSQLRSLIDPPTPAPSGPGFDYCWYPTANGRGGLNIDGTNTISTTVTGVDMLVGFGAGYKSYDGTNYRAGVGRYKMNISTYGFGGNIGGNVSLDPLHPNPGPERPVFEGQINTTGMTPGTYVLKVLPSADGTNILHGKVVYNAAGADYGGLGSFAEKANYALALPGTGADPSSWVHTGVKFVVNPPECQPGIKARRLFYNNSYYDGNNAGINLADIADPPPTSTVPWPHNDDGDAIDSSKHPLMPGDGTATFANWTGYAQGINGLIYDIKCPTRTPIQSDFTFTDIGKTGTAAIPVSTVSNFGTYTVPNPDAANPGEPATLTRVVITFDSTTSGVGPPAGYPEGSVQNTWLQVDIGTGFGLSAVDTHYWGNASGDTNVGNTATAIPVTTTDEIDIRTNRVTAVHRLDVTGVRDINKDSTVTTTDEIYDRTHRVTAVGAVRIIVR